LYASGRTTGFIIWLNGYGVLVDPPMQTTEFLRRHVRTEAPSPSFFSASHCGVVSRPNLLQGIHHRFVTKVILTHCHSDHDSGVVQMILEGLLSLSHQRTNARTRSRALLALIRVLPLFVFARREDRVVHDENGQREL
jgi:glyoxylase-like metal-dependent hydrolase (beta-lactamase superfamily II)